MKTNKTMRTNFSFIVFLLYLFSKRIVKLHSDIIYLTTSSTVNASYFVPNQIMLKMFSNFYVTGSNAFVYERLSPGRKGQHTHQRHHSFPLIHHSIGFVICCERLVYVSDDGPLDMLPPRILLAQ